jgi:hypothetical protein
VLRLAAAAATNGLKVHLKNSAPTSKAANKLPYVCHA